MAGHGESITIKTLSNFQYRLFFTLSYTELLSNSSLRSCLNCKSIICGLTIICIPRSARRHIIPTDIYFLFSCMPDLHFMPENHRSLMCPGLHPSSSGVWHWRAEN